MSLVCVLFLPPTVIAKTTDNPVIDGLCVVYFFLQACVACMARQGPLVGVKRLGRGEEGANSLSRGANGLFRQNQGKTLSNKQTRPGR